MAVFHRWTQREWEQAYSGLESQGVDVDRLTTRWGTSVNPEACGSLPDWEDDDVILTDRRHQWVLGVLASELEPSPECP